MTRDEIYDHLAQVYLGKKKKPLKKKMQFSAWLLINVFVTLIIFVASFYGLTAFLTKKGFSLKNNIIYSLHNGSVRFYYDFKSEYVPYKSFDLKVDDVDVSNYKKLSFKIRAKEEGTPGVVKVLIKNRLNEESYYYVQGVDFSWKELSLEFDNFKNITDWSNLTTISFVVESWNAEKQKGLILIDDINFSS